MFVILNKSTNKYYNGEAWEDSIRSAMHMTKPRADEIYESLQLQISKKMIVGDFVIVPIE